jgi:CheY-like chemotaxis protein
MKARFPFTPFTSRARSFRGEFKGVGTEPPVGERPLQTVESAPTQLEISSQALSRRWKKRVLLIDDEHVLTPVASTLKSERYDVILATDGHEAVQRCQRYSPDLIVVDLDMRAQNGWSMLKNIEEVCPFRPMIVITGKPLQYECAIAFGVDALMEKPLDFPILLAAIEKLLEEPEHERLARITNENFTTLKLNSEAKP